MNSLNRPALAVAILAACALLGAGWLSPAVHDALWTPQPLDGSGVAMLAVEAATMAGSEYAVVFLAVAVYLAFDRRLGKKLFLLFLVTGYLNVLLKGIFAIPRPSAGEAGGDDGYSFPSGHLQITSSFLGYLALHFGTYGWLALYGAGCVLIALTRVALNAHFPADTLAGLAIGTSLALLFDVFQSGVHRNRVLEDGNVRAFLVLVIPLSAIAIMSLMWGSAPDDAYRLSGLAMGFGIGDTLSRNAGYDVPRRMRGRIALVLAGAAALGVFAVLSLLVPEGALWVELLLMGCAGFSVSGAIPWLFDRYQRSL